MIEISREMLAFVEIEWLKVKFPYEPSCVSVGWLVGLLVR